MTWPTLALAAVLLPAFLGAAPAKLGQGVRSELLPFIGSSAASLDIQLPLLLDDGLESSLARAVTRGVKVRLLLGPQFKASRRGAARIRNLGVVLRYAALSANARVLIADGKRVLCGSFSGATSSLDRRLECLLASEDAAVAASWGAAFEEEWRAAKETAPESYLLKDELEALPNPVEDSDKEPRVKAQHK